MFLAWLGSHHGLPQDRLPQDSCSVKGRSGHQVGLPLLHFMARRLVSVGPAALSRQSRPDLIAGAGGHMLRQRTGRTSETLAWAAHSLDAFRPVLCFSALRSPSRGVRSACQSRHTPLPELQCAGGADRIPGAA